MRTRVMTLTAVLVLAAGAAYGQQGGRDTDGHRVSAAADQPAILGGQRSDQMTTDQLVGAPVTNMAGEEIGTVDALLVSRNGRVEGVIVALGGVLGLGARSVGIAWEQTSLDSQGRLRLSGVSIAELEAAPDFERAQGQEEPVRGDDSLGDPPVRDGKPQRLLK